MADIADAANSLHPTGTDLLVLCMCQPERVTLQRAIIDCPENTDAEPPPVAVSEAEQSSVPENVLYLAGNRCAPISDPKRGWRHGAEYAHGKCLPLNHAVMLTLVPLEDDAELRRFIVLNVKTSTCMKMTAMLHEQ